MTDSTAIVTADGDISVVNAKNVRVCVPTAKCMKFWAQFAICVLAIVIGACLVGFFPVTDAKFNVGIGFLTLGIGNMLPGPQFTDILPKTSSTSTTGAQIV